MDDQTKQIVEQIKSCLDRTMHEFDIDDDGDIYVRSGLEINTWVSVPNPDFVKFYTYYKLKDGTEADETKVNALVNRINDGFFPNSVSQGHGRLIAMYYLPIMDGFSERTFIHMLRRVAQSFRHAASREDTDDLVI